MKKALLVQNEVETAWYMTRLFSRQLSVRVSICKQVTASQRRYSALRLLGGSNTARDLAVLRKSLFISCEELTNLILPFATQWLYCYVRRSRDNLAGGDVRSQLLILCRFHQRHVWNTVISRYSDPERNDFLLL